MYEIVLVLNLALFLVVFTSYVRSPGASALHPASFYSAVHALVFVVRPMVAWARGYVSVYHIYNFMPSLGVKISAICASAVAYVIVMYVLRRWASSPVRHAQIPSDIRNRFKKPIVITAALLGPIAFYSAFTAFNNRANDINTMMYTATGYTVNTTGVGYFTDAQNMLIPLIMLVAWVFRFSLLSLMPLFAFVLLKAGSGGRGAFVIAIAAVGLLFLYESRRKWPTLRVMILLTIGMVLFTLVGEDRGRAFRSILGVESTVPIAETAVRHELLDSMDYANLEYLEFLMTTIPEKTKYYDYFLDNLQILTEPIPRVLWSGKPVGPPIQLYNLWEFGTPFGITYSVPGYGWAQLGWIGVVLWSSAAGGFLVLIYGAFQRRAHSPLVVIAYLGFLAGTIVYFRDGGLLTVLRSQIFFLLPLLMVHLLSGSARARVRLLARYGFAGYQMRLADYRARRSLALQGGGVDGLSDGRSSQLPEER